MKINEKLKNILLEKGLTTEIIEQIENQNRSSNKKEMVEKYRLDLTDLEKIIRELNEIIEDSGFVFGYYCKKKQ